MWQGRLYVGYGDYEANTGPIHVVSVDLADATVREEATLKTEEVWIPRVIGAELFMPYMDPRGGSEATWHYARATAPDSWSVDLTITPTPIHVMGMTRTPNGDLWACGANDSNQAVVWRSTDDGVTWAQALAVDSADVHRFYTFATHGSYLAVFGADTAGSPDTWQWDGSTWTQTTSPGVAVSDAVPFTYQGVPYWLCLPLGKQSAFVQAVAPSIFVRPEHSGSQAAITAIFDRTRQYLDAALSQDGQTLWLLDADGTIHRITPAGQRDTPIQVPDDIGLRSMVVDDDGGWFYFGSTDSKVYRTPIPA